MCFFAILAVIQVVWQRKGDRRCANKLQIEVKLWANEIAQTMVDATGKLVIFYHCR